VIGIFILVVTGLTSAGAYLFGLKGLRLPRGDFGEAVTKMLECIGTILVFAAVNLAVAATLILSLRGLTKTFVSLYLASDVAWLGLSVVQGLLFQWWRELSSPP